MTRLVLLTPLLLLALVACDDPQHGAYHVKGVWWIGVLLVTAIAGAALLVGALLYAAGTRFQAWRNQRCLGTRLDVAS